ncbi:MAG TPA: hypothetical protein VGA38_02755 [Candidatus Limnocylindria bacterium]
MDVSVCGDQKQEQTEVSCLGRFADADAYRYVFNVVGMPGLSTIPKSMVRMTTDCAIALDFDITGTSVALVVPRGATPAACRVRFVSANRATPFAFTIVLSHIGEQVGSVRPSGPPSLAPPGPIPSSPSTAVPPITAPVDPISVVPIPVIKEQIPSVVAGALHLADVFRGPASHNNAGSPDSGIAAGPQHLVITTNDEIQLRTKVGDILAQRPLLDFFTAALAPGEGYVGDPSVAFDPGSARFFVVASSNPHQRQHCALGSCLSHLVLAISRGAAPSTLDGRDWMFSSSDLTLDQDRPTQTQSDWNKIAVSDRAVMISAQPESLAEGTSAGATITPSLKIRVFDRDTLFRGATAPPWQDFIVPNALPGFDVAFVFQASTNVDTSGRAYFASLDARDCGLTVWAVEGTVPSAQLTSRRVPWDAPCATPLGIVQPAPGIPIHDSGLKFYANLINRGGSLWGVYTMRLRQGAFASQPSYLRWFQLDISTWPAPPRLIQQGLVGDGSFSLAFPALTVSARGDIAMVFNRVSGTEYASAYYAGRLAADPPGALRPMAPLKVGTSIVNCIAAAVSGRNAFADYSGAAIDPLDDTAWFIAQAATPGGSCEWVTFIGHVDYRINP